MPEKFHKVVHLIVLYNSQVAYSEISATLSALFFCWFSPDNHSQIGIGYFGHSLCLWKSSVKQPSPFVYNHLTHADICLLNISDTRAIKPMEAHASFEVWRRPLRTPPQTGQATACKLCVSKKKKKMSREGGGRALTTYGFPFKTHESGGKKGRECSLEIGYGWLESTLVAFPCPQRLKNYS